MQSHLFDTIKNLFMVLITGLMAVFSTYAETFIALLAGFTLNFVMGMLADAKDKESENFSMQKAIEGVRLLMFYSITVVCIYAMTYKSQSIADSAIRWLSYIVSYFYLTNIFRNANKVHPDNKAIEFIYLFLSTEVFLKLKEHLGIKRKS